MMQHIGNYKGIAMYYHGISYCCPVLKLYGYATDLALQRAINKILRKREVQV